MYCSACGVAVSQGLSYCNYCGASVSVAKGDSGSSPEVKPELVVSAMAGIFILGLVAIAVLIGVLKEVAAFDLPLLLAVTIFSFLLMLVIEGVLIKLLLRGKRAAKDVGLSERLKDHTTRELSEPNARMLHEPAASVTEHTTRAFDPIYTKGKSN